MIEVTRLNGVKFMINAEIIETLEASTGHTVLSLATSNRYLVKESVDEIAAKVIEYRKKINAERKSANPIQGFERT